MQLQTMPIDNVGTSQESKHLGLVHETKWGSNVLKNLLHARQRQDSSSAETITASAVPRSAVARACAVGFFEQNKYGAFVSVTKSRGFVIANRGWENGEPLWSAPCFFDMNTGGFGLSLGYETVYTTVLLNTIEALDEFVRSKTVVEVDMHYQLEDQPAVKEDENLGWDDMGEHEIRIYSAAQGKMIDMSMQGGTMAPSPDNTSFYGPAATVEDILSGTVKPPKEFASFYNSLTKMAQEGAMIVQKLKDEGIKVYPIYHAETGWRSTY